MNKKGNAFLGIFVALFVWFFGILFIPFIMDDVTTFRSAMDCSNTGISGASMISCLAGDLVIPYIIWTLLSISLGYIAGSKSGT